MSRFVGCNPGKKKLQGLQLVVVEQPFLGVEPIFQQQIVLNPALTHNMWKKMICRLPVLEATP